jgi:peptidoglycan/LPS O-acetylase OafA/YrhL
MTEALARRDSKPHFVMLDGLRGVAALAVVLFHTWAGGGPVPNGPLAVDFFFLLSGFVIAYSYDQRLLAGRCRLEFVLRRLIRLYPTVLVGAAGGIVIELIHNKTDPARAFPLHSVVSSGTLSLFLLPYLGPNMGATTFSFNPPLWSLSFELLANLVYVVLIRRLSLSVLSLIVIVELIGIALGGSLGGNTKDTILLGFPRVGCGFFGGILLFRLFQRGKLPKINGNFFVLIAVLMIIFCYPGLISSWAFLPVYILFVGVIVCACGARPSLVDKLCSFLGVISYPIYLIHWLTLYIFTFIGAEIGLRGKLYIYVAIAHSISVPFIAYAVALWYDTPIRRFLSGLFLQKITIAETEQPSEALSVHEKLT